MSEPFYVYVAGPLSDYPAQYLANVRMMSLVSRKLIDAGYTTINPAGDMLDGLMSTTPLTIEQYQQRSMDLLRLLKGQPRAALYVLSGIHADGRLSRGVAAEVEQADVWGIPIARTVDELDALRGEG
jgi:hypothetical protein